MFISAYYSRKICFTAIVLVVGIGLTACATDYDHKLSASPSSSYQPSTAVEESPTTSRIFPGDSTYTPATPSVPWASGCEYSSSVVGVTLLSVSVTDGAVGHPSGAQTVTWVYSGDVSAEQITFGIASPTATRVVKFQNGEMITNSFMETGEKSTNLTTPVPFTPYEQKAPIPAAIGSSFNQGWIADMSVNGVRVGQCSAGGF